MITYSDLSLPLRILVVLNWIIIGINVLAFMLGLMIGLIGI